MESSAYYRKLLDTAALAGLIMISSGAETHRVEDTMTRILSIAGFEKAEAIAFPTCIIATLSDPNMEDFSLTRRVKGVSNNLGRVAEVNQVSRRFCDGFMTLDEAYLALKHIQTARRYSDFVHFIAYVIASCTFSVVFGGEYLDGVGTIFCGIVLALIVVYLGKRIKQNFMICILATVGITLTAAAVSFIFDKLFDVHFQAQYLVMGSLMPLVPGLAFTNATRDILHGDFLSGGVRAIEAICVASCLSVGVGAGVAIAEACHFAGSLSLDVQVSVSNFTEFIVAVLSAGVAITALFLVFEIKPKLLPFCGLSSALCWAVYLACDSAHIHPIWSAFFATLVVNLYAYISARVLKAPVIIFLFAGILPLVPGISLYQAVYATIYGDPLASKMLLDVLLCTGAIALAIFLMDSFLEFDNAFRKRKKKKPTK